LIPQAGYSSTPLRRWFDGGGAKRGWFTGGGMLQEGSFTAGEGGGRLTSLINKNSGGS
jgi:hypothetical protein